MPSPRALLNAFNLSSGVIIGNYSIDNIDIQERVVERYKSYEFPITITFTGYGDVNSLAIAFNNYVRGHKVVNSDYGNPYDCYFDPVHIINEKTLTVTAHANRVPK